jgi:hypothetical protein
LGTINDGQAPTSPPLNFREIPNSYAQTIPKSQVPMSNVKSNPKSQFKKQNHWAFEFGISFVIGALTLDISLISDEL